MPGPGSREELHAMIERAYYPFGDRAWLLARRAEDRGTAASQATT